MGIPDWVWNMLAVGGSGVVTGGVGVPLFQAYLNRKKSGADARKVDAEAEQIFGEVVDARIKILLEGLYHQIEWSEANIARLQRQVAEQEEQIAKQTMEIRQLRTELAICLENHRKLTL